MRQRGFTLVELLVTVAIIGLLTTLAVASFKYAQEKAKKEKTAHDLATINNAIGMLANDTNQWPGHQEVMKLATGASNNELCTDGCANDLKSDAAGLEGTDGAYEGWAGPYLVKTLIDPWGNEYFFDSDYQINIDGEPCNGGGACVDAVVVGSYGPNGTGNNAYDSDDIIKLLFK